MSTASAWLRQVVQALGQRRDDRASHDFLKLDCRHVHSLALIRLALPETPCLFLYRDPQAVLASHRRQRGPQMVPGMLHPALLPAAPASLPPGDLNDYAATVLHGLFEAADAAAHAGQLDLLHYAQLPEVIIAPAAPLRPGLRRYPGSRLAPARKLSFQGRPRALRGRPARGYSHAKRCGARRPGPPGTTVHIPRTPPARPSRAQRTPIAAPAPPMCRFSAKN